MSNLSKKDIIWFRKIEPTFLVACSLDTLANNKDSMAALSASRKWLNQLLTKADNSEPPSNFTTLRRDVLRYPSKPTPEKEPLNKQYFELHGSLVCDCLKEFGEKKTDAFEACDISIRIFESGTIGARCPMKPRHRNKEYDIDSAVCIMRDGRSLARKLLYNAIQLFIQYWNKMYSNYSLKPLEGMKEFLLFEKYEYVDFEFSKKREYFDTKAPVNEETILFFRQLIGFCRMSKPYTWPKNSIKFLRNFINNDISSRIDEFWFAYPERFVRYYPNKDISETTDYAYDILLILEVLLGLRALYKSLIEDIHLRFIKLPESASKHQKDIKTAIIHLQKELSVVIFRLSKCQFPSSLKFYADNAFAADVIRHIHNVLDIDELSVCLKGALDKLNSFIEYFSSLVMHNQNITLQRRILWLTIVIGIVGALLTAAQLIN